MENIQVNPMFGDGMVLQRDKKVPIWGTGTDGTQVRASCGGQTAEAVVKDGSWQVELSSMSAGGPYELVISAEGEQQVLRDVWVGEVWLAGGQSNMQFKMDELQNKEEKIAAANHPNLRYFHVPQTAHENDPMNKEWETAHWKICTPQEARWFSAVAYYFAKDLLDALDVPIGIINCNWGGTSASCWIDESYMTSDKDLKEYVDEYNEMCKTMTWEEYSKQLDVYNQSIEEYNKRRESLPPGADPSEAGAFPWPPPNGPGSFLRVSGLHQNMILKTAPYQIRGFIYYQGESDTGKAGMYDKLLSQLIRNWRADWKDEELWFLFVQLPGFGGDNPDGEDWAVLRESQLQTAQRMENTEMAVALDCGDLIDLHPPHKQPIGDRLALIARNKVYGQSVECSGPVLQEMIVEGSRAELRFGHAGSGLAAAMDRPLAGFELAGDDGKFNKAIAEIQGDTVILHSEEVYSPKHVRYGWANYTTANLVNSEGLPASPFRK